MLALPFPTIDPILLSFGPLAIRWYGLAYVAGVLLGWYWMRRIIRSLPLSPFLKEKHIDGFLTSAMIGIVVGGRLGYTFFYETSSWAEKPLKVFALWEGGMSFHGGFLGILIAAFWHAHRYHIPFLRFTDAMACAAPIGLFFGRIANFINGELYGRMTDVPWAVIFPYGGERPRHPSQIYEAILEGLVLFFVCNFVLKRPFFAKEAGRTSGVFVIGYGLSRMLIECFREPDVQIGYLIGGTTLGQWLTLPFLVMGVYLLNMQRGKAG